MGERLISKKRLTPNDAPLIYLWAYQKMLKKYKAEFEIPNAELLEIVRRTFYQIPRALHYSILKDMSRFGLLELSNGLRFKIRAVKCPKLKQLNEYVYW